MQLYAYLGDLAQAQDVVQEAFARALPHWIASSPTTPSAPRPGLVQLRPPADRQWASRSRRRQDFLTSLEVQADGTVAFMVRNFEGMGQCLYRGKWTADGFVGTCEP